VYQNEISKRDQITYRYKRSIFSIFGAPFEGDRNRILANALAWKKLCNFDCFVTGSVVLT